MKKQKCPECEGTIVTEEEESYCSKCGLVIDDEPIYQGKVTLTSHTTKSDIDTIK